MVVLRIYEVYRANGFPMEIDGEWVTSTNVSEDELIDVIRKIVGHENFTIDFSEKTVYVNGKPYLYFDLIDTVDVNDSNIYVELHAVFLKWTVRLSRLKEFVEILNPNSDIEIDFKNRVVKVDGEVKYLIYFKR